MSQVSTFARVYIEGGPVARLRPNTDKPGGRGSHAVEQTQREMQREIVLCLTEGKPIEGTTVEGDAIVIPASRVVDVVFPLDRQGPESGMDEDQRNAEAFLSQHGSVATAIKCSNREFVEAYLANSGFGGEVIVMTTDNRIGAVVAFTDKTINGVGVFTVEGPTFSEKMLLENIVSVLCWEWEDVLNGTNDTLTSAGFDTGVGTMAKAMGRTDR